MTLHTYIPEGYERIKVVDDAYAFLTTDFAPHANVVLYPRTLRHDYHALAEQMARYFDLGEEELFIKYSERHSLEEFRGTLECAEMRAALDHILWDMEFLHTAEIRTHLRLLTRYKIHADTYKFHVDGLEQDFDRYMSCYTPPVTQFIRNEDVIKVSGHDAIYREGAPVYQFGVGDIWKSRVRNKPRGLCASALDDILKRKERRAFVHRAQISEKPRLILVGDRRL